MEGGPPGFVLGPLISLPRLGARLFHRSLGSIVTPADLFKVNVSPDIQNVNLYNLVCSNT